MSFLYRHSRAIFPEMTKMWKLENSIHLFALGTKKSRQDILREKREQKNEEEYKKIQLKNRNEKKTNGKSNSDKNKPK